MPVIKKIGEWFDHRLQLAASIREAAGHDVPRNAASWFYVFGSAALTVFILQLVLTKPEVNFLVLITTFVRFYLASATEGRPLSFAGLFNTLLGTLLVASGTGTLNQYLERKHDAQMRRTARRPAAAGRLKPLSVLVFGISSTAVGSIYLAMAVGLLASVLATLTLLTYLFVYTPLKRRTPLCTLVGAFPGAPCLR